MAVNKVIFGGETVIDLTNDTVVASKMLSGTTAHDKAGNAVTGTIATKTSSNLTASGATVTVPAGYYASQATKSVATATQATPTISVSSSGLITASATQSAGYVASGTKSATKQLTVQAAKTVTPTTSNQTAVASGRYTTGAITVKGDANLVAGNIKSGVTIFGVTGTHSGGEDLTAVINQQATLISQLETALQNAASGGGGGSVETCTVIMVNEAEGDYPDWQYFYTYFDGSKITGGGRDDTDVVYTKSVTLTNVVCGSTITVVGCNGTMTYYCTVSDSTMEMIGNVSGYGTVAFTAPTTPNTTATITFGCYID